MADSTVSTACIQCGGSLDEHDIEHHHGMCHGCRSSKGSIADLDIAIRASGDDPQRIGDWPVIRHLLRKRFGEDRSDSDLWERCTDWLRAEGRLMPNDYLAQPLDYLQGLLENGFAQPDQCRADQKLEALHTFQRELENWNSSNSPSETGYVSEAVQVGHPLHSADVAERGDAQAAIRLLSVFTDGLADERLDRAGNILNDDKLTVDEKLWKIDALMPIPPTVAAAKLGKALGVSKTAVQKTTWYSQKRKGEKASEIGRRQEQHRKRGKDQKYELDRQSDDD